MPVNGAAAGSRKTASRPGARRGRGAAGTNGGSRSEAGVHEQLLTAALKVFAAAGTRGATTRRIAQEAGVNEVTLFRHFGSKEALIRQAVSSTNNGVMLARLPDKPVDPEQELMAWSEVHYQFLFSIRSFIRIGMAEFLEHPEVTMAACQFPVRISNDLYAYLTRVRAAGLGGGAWNARAAASMLMGALFADAMQRDVMPARYPYSQRDAVKHYVSMFLCAIGVTHAAVAAPASGRRATKSSRRLPNAREPRHA
jgi:AcrR family transcriptional regulator